MAVSSFPNPEGNFIVAQSGGPTAVINATLAGVLLEAGQRAVKGKIFGMPGGLEGFLNGKEPFNLSSLSTVQIEQLSHTGGAALGSCRFKPDESHFARLLELLNQSDIHYFLYIGGNGSMLTPLKLDRYAREQGYELYCIGLPKTVDNDMHGTDHTPGYASAARWLATHTRDSALDLYTMRGFDHFKLIEVMGRHAGWLAAATWLAQSENFAVPHLVLVPEIIFDEQFFLSEVERIFRQEGCVLAVASEGLRNAEGQFLAELSGTLQKDAIGKPILSIGEGVAGYLCRLVSQKLGIKARYDKPGTLQRGAACVSPVDYQEALALGKMGLQIALEGKSAVMPGLVRVSDKPFRCVIEPVALAEIAGTEKPLPAEFLTETGVNIEAFCRYAAPLIGQPLEVPFRFEN